MVFLSSLFLNNLNIHSSWNKFIFQSHILDMLKSIEGKIVNSDYNPKSEQVLRFLQVNLQSLKVIILGQDPYPQKGVAVGRAFQVGGLQSWQDKFSQTSLRNILRNIYLTYTNELKTMNEIRKEISSKQFEIKEPNELFDSWELQGVLLLNTTFTCETGKPGSHAKLWSNFTNELLKFINDEMSECIWFLWGNFAKSYESLVGKNKYICNHPMMAGKNNENDFLKCKCFIETKDIINWK